MKPTTLGGYWGAFLLWAAEQSDWDGAADAPLTLNSIFESSLRRRFQAALQSPIERQVAQAQQDIWKQLGTHTLLQLLAMAALPILIFSARPHHGPVPAIWNQLLIAQALLVVVLNAWGEIQFRSRTQSEKLDVLAINDFASLASEVSNAYSARIGASGFAALTGLMLTGAAAHSDVLRIQPLLALNALGALVFFVSAYARFPGAGWVNDFLRDHVKFVD